jgi:hypothetical protein
MISTSAHALRVMVLSGLLLVPALASGPAPMIPPGEEELLAEMLGRGDSLAGCAFTDAEVQFTVIKVTYICPGGAAAFELCHPSQAPRTAIQTAQFAFTKQSGSAPRSLVDALVSRIRSREDAFEWEWPGGQGNAAANDAN